MITALAAPSATRGGTKDTNRRAKLFKPITPPRPLPMPPPASTEPPHSGGERTHPFPPLPIVTTASRAFASSSIIILPSRCSKAVINDRLKQDHCSSCQAIGQCGCTSGRCAPNTPYLATVIPIPKASCTWRREWYRTTYREKIRYQVPAPLLLPQSPRPVLLPPGASSVPFLCTDDQALARPIIGFLIIHVYKALKHFAILSSQHQ